MRRYDSLAQRQEMEDAYYSSDDGSQGPREAMLALIESYIDAVFFSWRKPLYKGYTNRGY
jgi:hypothetical protein